MNKTCRFPAPVAIPFLAALLAAFLLPGCSKTPEDHARIASDPRVRFEKSMASVQALAEANNQMLLAEVAAASGDARIQRAALDKLTEPRAMAAFAKRAGKADLAAGVLEKITDRQLLADVVANAGSVFVRIEAAALLDDQAALANIAKGTRSPDVLAKIVEKLTDQAALSALAKASAGNERAWGPALDKINDQPLLAALARDAVKHQALSVKATGKLRDQAVLEEIARSALPEAVRKAAIAILTSQRALADIAGNDPDASIRQTAARWLNDQPALAAIAKNDAEKSVRLQAVERLGDQRALVAIVNGKARADDDADDEVKAAALKKISDQQLLADVVKNADSSDLKDQAAEQISDPQLLAAIVKNNGNNDSVREKVTERLTDQRLLADIAKNDYNESVRRAAVERLADQQLLADIAKADKSETIRQAAANRITDQNVLAGIAKNEADSETAWGILEKLNDPSLLADVAASSRHRKIRDGAVDRISAPQTLADLARREDAEADARLLAVWRLADKALLSGLAGNAPDERVRQAAGNKLAEKTQGAARGIMADLINEGKLLAVISGDSIRNLDVRLKKIVPWPLEVVIPAGTYFVCDNKKAQNMVSTADVNITLRTDSHKAGIPVACANKPKDIPREHDSFVIGSPANAEELKKLMAAPGGENVHYYIKQAAVWIVTDNANYSDLGALRTVRRGAFHAPFGPPGERSIGEAEAAGAIRLCAGAGIDIKKKAIWGDCVKILAGLKAGELKNWLRTFSGFAVPAHKEGVVALGISLDGKLLASGDDSGGIKLWSLPDGALVRALEAHGDNVDCLAISPDGTWLVSRGNDDSYMKLWHLPDGRLARDESVKKQNGDEHLPFARVNAAAFSPDGKWFVTGDDDGFIKLWSLPGGMLTKTLERQVTAKEGGALSLNVLALGSDGGMLATEGENNIIKLWSLPDGALVRTLEGHRKHLRFVSIASDGKHLVSGSDDEVVKVWSLPDGALLNTLEKRTAWSAAVSPDGDLLAAAVVPERDRRGRRTASEPRVSLWRLPDGAEVSVLESSVKLRASAIAPGNKLLVIGDTNGDITFWSLPDGKFIKTLEGE